MRGKSLIFLLLCLFLTLVGSHVPAAEKVAQQQWQQITSDEAFSYRDKVEVVEKPPKNNLVDNFLNGIIGFFSSKWGKVIIWTLFFLLAGWALFKIFIGDKTGLFARKARGQTGDGDGISGEDLEGTDWERQLRQAISRNDVRLAVRYSYMYLLQLLQEKELIRYRNDKTNQEYYIELGGTQYGQAFRQLSRQYEYAWYGNYPLSTEAYNTYMDTFNIVKHKLGR